MLRFLIVTAYQCTYMSGKNSFKRLIGRTPHPPHVLWNRERWLLLRHLVLHISHIRPIRRITCRGLMNEGPGSHALSVMGAIHFARLAGLTYLHTPFEHIAHADRPDREWNQAWERLFSLGDGEAPCTDNNVLSYEHGTDGLRLLFGISQVQTLHLGQLAPEFRRRYRINNPPHQKCDTVKIAAHIRRGPDIAPNDPVFTPINEALQAIAEAHDMLARRGIPHGIKVYSEGDAADFDAIQLDGVEIAKYRVGRSLPAAKGITDIDALTALQEMVEADIFIMSRGSLSECAALLSDGIKIRPWLPW